jgi:hypothetical protein
MLAKAYTAFAKYHLAKASSKGGSNEVQVLVVARGG